MSFLSEVEQMLIIHSFVELLQFLIQFINQSPLLELKDVLH